jgi:hypothetical protein
MNESKIKEIESLSGSSRVKNKIHKPVVVSKPDEIYPE